MALWSEQDFSRVASETRLSARTLAACKDVLVNGLFGSHAADKHKMAAPQVSRGVTQLRAIFEKQAEPSFDLGSGPLIDRVRFAAMEFTKAELGTDTIFKDIGPGGVYSGPILLNVSVNGVGFTVQKVGASVVLHDLSKLDVPAQLEDVLTISYDLEMSKASVKPFSKNVKTGLER